MKPVELVYSAKPIHLFQRTPVQRFVILLALLWMGWMLLQRGKPYWCRFVCYRLEQEAKTYMSIPGRVAFRHTATQPYAPSTIPNDRFFDRLGEARADVGSDYCSASTSTRTPIFCGQLRSAAGYQSMAEIFVDTEPTTPQKYWGVLPRGPIPPSGLEAASFRIRSWKPLTPKWILNRNDGSDGGVESIVQFPLLPPDTLTVNGAKIDPTDPSVVDLSIVLNNQPIHLRFHMIGQGLFGFEQHGLGAADRRWSGAGLQRWPIGSTDLSD